MIDIRKFIKKLHNFEAKSYFVNNEEAVQKIMVCDPKECLELDIPMNTILQIYKQSIVYLNQNNRSGGVCRSVIRGLHEIKASCVETDFV